MWQLSVEKLWRGFFCWFPHRKPIRIVETKRKSPLLYFVLTLTRPPIDELNKTHSRRPNVRILSDPESRLQTHKFNLPCLFIRNSRLLVLYHLLNRRSSLQLFKPGMEVGILSRPIDILIVENERKKLEPWHET